MNLIDEIKKKREIETDQKRKSIDLFCEACI
jgi:hypothetical protein